MAHHEVLAAVLLGPVLVCAVTVLLASLNRPIAAPIVLGATARAVAGAWHHLAFPLPDSGADAASFQRVAQEIARSDWSWQSIEPSSYFISGVLGGVYRLAGTSNMIVGQAVSVAVGTWVIVVAARLAQALWNNARTERRVAWAVALFPTLVLYSALPMREVYVALAVTGALLCATRALVTGRSSHLVVAVASFVVAIFFHGGVVTGVLALAAVVAVSWVQVGVAIRLIVVAVGMFTFLVWDPDVPKIGTLASAVTSDVALSMLSSGARGDAAFPDLVTTQSGVMAVVMFPVRVLYFLAAPFPWDVRSTGHMLGLLDGGAHLLLLAQCVRGRRKMFERVPAMSALVVIGALVVTFAVGTSNFGTAIRHRAKFSPAILAVVMGTVGQRSRMSRALDSSDDRRLSDGPAEHRDSDASVESTTRPQPGAVTHPSGREPLV